MEDANERTWPLSISDGTITVIKWLNSLMMDGTKRSMTSYITGLIDGGYRDSSQQNLATCNNEPNQNGELVFKPQVRKNSDRMWHVTTFIHYYFHQRQLKATFFSSADCIRSLQFMFLSVIMQIVFLNVLF